MREITLQPGTSIEIDGVIVRAVDPASDEIPDWRMAASKEASDSLKSIAKTLREWNADGVPELRVMGSP